MMDTLKHGRCICECVTYCLIYNMPIYLPLYVISHNIKTIHLSYYFLFSNGSKVDVVNCLVFKIRLLEISSNIQRPREAQGTHDVSNRHVVLLVAQQHIWLLHFFGSLIFFYRVKCTGHDSVDSLNSGKRIKGVGIIHYAIYNIHSIIVCIRYDKIIIYRRITVWVTRKRKIVYNLS